MAKIKKVNIYKSKEKRPNAVQEMNLILAKNIQRQMVELNLSYEQKIFFIDSLLDELHQQNET